MSKKGKWVSYVTLHSYGGYWLHHWENNTEFDKTSYLNLVNLIVLFYKFTTILNILKFYKCMKTGIALKAIRHKHKVNYQFGIPSSLLSCKKFIFHKSE